MADDSSGAIGVDLRQGLQKQAADVGEHGGTARRDAVLGEELVEVHEGIVDALRGLEVSELRSQVLVVIGVLRLFLCGAMLRAETGMRVGSRKTALTAGGSAISTTNGDGLSGLSFHILV